jgi:hypothetical protein
MKKIFDFRNTVKSEIININLKIYFFYYITQLNFFNQIKLNKNVRRLNWFWYV